MDQGERALDDAVRLIAYFIWEQDGRPDGRDMEHWFRAKGLHEQQPDITALVATSKPNVRPRRRLSPRPSA